MTVFLDSATEHSQGGLWMTILNQMSPSAEKCKERNFPMIDNPTQTMWKSGSIVSPRKGWASKMNMSTTGHSSPLHHWMRDSFASREPQATAYMKGDQQITQHTWNLHQKKVGIGWPPKGENFLLTTCKKNTYVESSKHLLWKILREMRACAQIRRLMAPGNN